MAQLQWQTIQSNTPQVDYVAKAKEFLEPREAINAYQFGTNTTTEDYFNNQQANTIFNSQMKMWETLTQSQDEINQLKDYYSSERERYLSNYGDLVNKYSDLVDKYSSNNSSNPTVNDYRNASNSSSFKPSKWQEQDTQGIMYQTFRSKGLNHNQALGLLMNIQAENDFGDKYIFGTHQDGNKTAYGALSWQSGRESGLLNKLQSEGLYDPVTKEIKKDPKAIQLQAEYMINELKSGRQGNYLNFTGSNPLDYARYANKVYTRSSTDPNVLKGRERAYQRLLQSRDWESYLNPSEPLIKQNSNYSNFAKGKRYNSEINYGGLLGNILGHSLYTISSGFGSRNTGIKGASTYHPAIDISAPIGTQIYSPFKDAIVYETGSDDKAGNYLTLQDRQTGTFVQFLHNKKLNFTKGQSVTNKDVIALSGNTGIGSGAHIDMRVFNKDGYAISPDGKVHSYRHKRLRG